MSAIDLGPVVAADRSFHDFSSRFTDQRSQEVGLESFKGKWVVASIAYSSCPSVCQMTVDTLKKLEKSLSKYGKSVETVLFNIDPTDATAQNMAEFLNKKKVNSPRWHFLAGSISETRDLSAWLQMGFGEKGAAPNAHIMHSFKLALISPKGELVEVVDGTKFNRIVDRMRSQ